MQDAMTLTMASVGRSIRGSSTTVLRMSRGPWIRVASMRARPFDFGAVGAVGVSLYPRHAALTRDPRPGALEQPSKQLVTKVQDFRLTTRSKAATTLDAALVHLTIQPGGRPQTHAQAEAGVSATLDSVIGGEPDAMVPLDLIGDGSIVMWTSSQARQPNEAATRIVAACGGTSPVFGPVVIFGLDADGEPISLSNADASALLRMLEHPAPA